MKKAFTLLELVFVIAIVGILAVVLAPNFQRDSLQEAANQIVSHIRYTQHLAMMDNKFDSSDANWFQGRWEIRFYKNLSFTSLIPNKTYNDIWAYTIYADKPHYLHNAGKKEMAKNPLNNKKYLSGGSANELHVEDSDSMESMRLSEKFGIKDVRFSNGCRGGITHIQFDNLGRPFNNYITTNNPYGVLNSSYPRLIIKTCNIDICIVDDCTVADTDEKITIAIEPETGYTHIL